MIHVLNRFALPVLMKTNRRDECCHFAQIARRTIVSIAMKRKGVTDAEKLIASNVTV